MKVTLIGIDLAKTIFQVCGVNQAGKPVFNRTIRRAGLLSFVSRYPDAVVAMEACGGSNYWGRELQKRGYEVKLIPPQHVKPFVKGNKTDRHDALAICEAAGRPELRCVMPRSVEQTDRLLAHRLREQAVGGAYPVGESNSGVVAGVWRGRSPGEGGAGTGAAGLAGRR